MPKIGTEMSVFLYLIESKKYGGISTRVFSLDGIADVEETKESAQLIGKSTIRAALFNGRCAVSRFSFLCRGVLLSYYHSLGCFSIGFLHALVSMSMQGNHTNFLHDQSQTLPWQSDIRSIGMYA